MPVVAIQGLRGGTGATSLTAALSWALTSLGEAVLAIDCCVENQLAAHFNAPLDAPRGWMQALLEGERWQESALRYQPGLDLLPFGHIVAQDLSQDGALSASLAAALPAMKNSGQWLLLDTPATPLRWHQPLLAHADAVLQVLTPDANCHLRLHQQAFNANTRFLINQFNANSKLQQDLHQLWIASLRNLIPVLIHRDEALAESLMMKQPLGEYRPHALASEEVTTLANWLILQVAGVAR
ncbi:cellulose biosynthesis protein BcsQ [Pantoea sp. LMR881]|uniref:cellulose biosynthesis protein BcsQ n=1 Tax=Pantoea sp. LMR881 TaxID=3014336 RepID=UPI0022AFECB9|nr:cellulose biosynthesis protein BcsQ [Pantoea sp. LMR881]MCZ4059652.1 cellulose biosynthesis protein BcsQ [Pantoea sp. LMR881]